MKNIKTIFAIIILAITIQSCAKDKESTTTTTDDSATEMQQSSDESIQTNESEYAMNDVSTAIENSSYGKTFLITGATIDSVIADKKLIITYNGNNADATRLRAGQIIVQLTTGAHWKDKNAVITVTFINYKVTRNSTGKSMTLNGTHLITNVSGGLVSTLIPNTSVIHRIGGSMTISFDDGTQRVWAITRQREIGLTITGAPYISVSGYGVKDSLSNIVVIGTNRAGIAFYTSISTPIIFSSTCSWLPVSGVKIHKGILKEITVTFGVDAAGNTVTLPTCPFGFKINWTNILGVSKQAVISY